MGIDTGKPYGAWISPKGEVIEVNDQCQHKKYLDYGVADEEGWICIVYGSVIKKSYIPDYFCSRLNPKTTTKTALKSLLKLINNSDKVEFCFEDIWKEPFEGFTWQSCVVDVIGARNLIREIAAGKIRCRD